MKRVAALFSAIIIISLSTYAKAPVAEGSTFSELGRYVIEKSSAPLIYDGRILRTYDVTYENSDIKVRIAIDDSNRRCRNYIVVSDWLSIEYKCRNNVFGTVLLEEKYAEDGIPCCIELLDKEAYFRQKVITQNETNEIDRLMMISVFYPELIDNSKNVIP